MAGAYQSAVDTAWTETWTQGNGVLVLGVWWSVMAWRGATCCVRTEASCAIPISGMGVEKWCDKIRHDPNKAFSFWATRLQRGDDPLPLKRRKVMALLAYLAQTHQPQSRETLATLLWPDFDQSKALASLRRELTRIKSEVGEILQTDRLQVSLSNAADVWVDTAEFTQKLAQAHNPSEKISALSLATAPFLDGFHVGDCPEFDEWQFFEREGLQNLFQAALVDGITFLEDQQQAEQAIPLARQLLAIDPLAEAHHRWLMRLYAAAGQKSAAVRQFETLTRILKEELNVEPEEESAALLEQINSAPAPNRNFHLSDAERMQHGRFVKTPSAVALPPIHMPTPPTPMIGRDHERAALIDYLLNDEIRLVTINGVGGMGKTRLSLGVMQTLASEQIAHPFKDGLYFVPLAPLNSAEDLMPKLADMFALTSASVDLETLVLNYLRIKQVLLVLDNFEHILDGTHHISSILEAAPGVTCLVTSRERLRLTGEWIFRLDGLDLSPTGSRQSAAADLLIERVQNLRGMADLSEVDLKAVDQICHLVQGLPLALVLAAGWADMLSLSEIADEISNSLDILSSEMNDIPERQRSLKVVFETSWERLSPAEQRSFATLSVFRGGFTRDAAAKVANVSLPMLRSLVNKSLIQPRPEQDRYDIHALLSQLGDEKLIEATQSGEVAHQHAKYFLEWMRDLEPDLRGRRQIDALHDIGADFENIRSAWRWAAATGRHDYLQAAEMTLFMYFDIFSRYVECLDLYRATAPLLGRTELANRITVRMVYLKSWLLIESVEPQQLDNLPHEAIGQGTDLHNKAFLPMTLGFVNMFKLQKYQEAILHFNQALTQFLALDDAFFAVNVMQRIGYCFGNQARAEEFFTYMHQSLELARNENNRSDIMKSAGNLIIGNFTRANLDQSTAYAQLNLDLAGQINSQIQRAFALSNFAYPLLVSGRFADARNALVEALSIATIASFPITLGYANAGMALLLAIEENVEEAASYIQNGWRSNPNTVSSLFLNWAESIVALLNDDLAETKNKLLNMLTIGVMGQAVGIVAFSMPVLLVYLVKQSQYQLAADIHGVIVHQYPQMNHWTAEWELYQTSLTKAESAVSAEQWQNSLNTGKNFDMLDGAQALLTQL